MPVLESRPRQPFARLPGTLAHADIVSCTSLVHSAPASGPQVTQHPGTHFCCRTHVRPLTIQPHNACCSTSFEHNTSAHVTPPLPLYLMYTQDEEERALGLPLYMYKGTYVYIVCTVCMCLHVCVRRTKMSAP